MSQDRIFGRLVLLASEWGGHTALLAVVDLLERHQLHEAAELVREHGRAAMDEAFSTEAWRHEIPAVGHTEQQQPDAIALSGKTASGGQDGMG